MNARRREGGFTLTEVMVVLVIIAALAAIASPRLSRNRAAQDGKEFANDVTRELQRARMEAIATRLPMFAFIFSDRVEIKSSTPPPAATPAALPGAPSYLTATTPILRSIRARTGEGSTRRVTVVDIKNSATAPTAPQLDTAADYMQLIFTTLGEGYISVPTTAPAMPAAPVPTTAVYLFIENTAVALGHPDRRLRIDISPLTGFVDLKMNW